MCSREGGWQKPTWENSHHILIVFPSRWRVVLLYYGTAHPRVIDVLTDHFVFLQEETHSVSKTLPG
jgi:hypothetical protein